MRKKTQFIIFTLCFFALLCALLTWGYTSTPQTSTIDSTNTDIFHTGWSQTINGAEIPLEDIQNFIPVEEGEALVFTCTLPDIPASCALLFYASNQNVTATINDICVMDFSTSEELALLQTPGSAWIQIDLSPEMSGQTFRLELISEIKGHTNQLYPVYLLPRTAVFSARLTAIWFHCLVAICLFILTLVCSLCTFIWGSTVRKVYYLRLGALYLIGFLWLVSYLHLFDIFTTRPIVGFLINMLLLRCVPLALFHALSIRMYIFPKTSHVLGTLCVLNVFLPWVLQFAFGISLLHTVWINSALFVLIFLLYLSTIFVKNPKTKSNPIFDTLPAHFIIVMLGASADFILTGRTAPEVYPFAGLFTVIALVIYNILMFISINRYDATLELRNQKLRTAALAEQIKAHFIFNALNSIRAIYRQDPLKGDDSIVKFSTYLRSFMKLINKKENISFREELDIIESYLALEKLRFDDTFFFTTEILFDDFEIPPLSVQPLVENAVIHGSRGRAGKGYVSVIATREGDVAQITISDNGNGFDTACLKDAKGVGLRNIQERVHTMVGGTVTIDSRTRADKHSNLGTGTVVHITIPLTGRKSGKYAPPPLLKNIEIPRFS